jgi:hypothetical protein
MQVPDEDRINLDQDNANGLIGWNLFRSGYYKWSDIG